MWKWADSNIQKWLVTNISPEIIIKLLRNKITIRDSFLKEDGLKYSILYDKNMGNFKIEKDNINDWDSEKSINLPTAGEFMD